MKILDLLNQVREYVNDEENEDLLSNTELGNLLEEVFAWDDETWANLLTEWKEYGE